MTTTPSTSSSYFGFEVVPFPDEVFRENPLEAGDGGHVLSVHPSRPLIMGALYKQPECDPDHLYFVPSWSHFALRIPSAGFRQSREFLRNGNVVFKKMFYSSDDYTLPPFSWTRAYIYQTFTKDGKRMTRGDEGFTGFTTIVSTQPYEKGSRSCNFYIRDTDIEAKHLAMTPDPATFQRSVTNTVSAAMGHTPSLSGAVFSVEILKVDTEMFNKGADAAMVEIEKLSPTLPDDGKCEPLGNHKEVEPSWAAVWGTHDVPSRLLHDYCRPNTTTTPFLLIAHVVVTVKGRDFRHRDSEHRYNEEMTKLLVDTMRVNNFLVVVGERPDTVLRGVRRNQFRGAKSGYGGGEAEDAVAPSTDSVWNDNKGFYIDQMVSLYGPDYMFRNACTKREGYAEDVKTKIHESPMHEPAKKSLREMLYAALYNPIAEGSRLASRYRSPKYFRTEILDQMLFWAAVYPSHLAKEDQHNERTLRPLFARWYLDWGVRIGKFFTPLGSRQHNGKFHICFLFDGHRKATIVPYEPPYHLYTHVGNNIMLRGVPFYQYTRAGTKNMHRSNNVTIYGGVHHVPPDADKEDPPSTCFRNFSAVEDTYKTKMYEVTAHISGRTAPPPSSTALQRPLVAAPIAPRSQTPAMGKTPLPPSSVCLERHREMAATPVGTSRTPMKTPMLGNSKKPPPPKRSRYMSATPLIPSAFTDDDDDDDIWGDEITVKRPPPLLGGTHTWI